jgi:hypothetical protein
MSAIGTRCAPMRAACFLREASRDVPPDLPLLQERYKNSPNKTPPLPL